MTCLDTTDVEKPGPAPYETPTFDPRSAFAWTLRSAEIGRRELQKPQHGVRQRHVVAPDEPAAVATVLAARHDDVPARTYETPTFNPRGAFAWTLRCGEIARLERRRLHPV